MMVGRGSVLLPDALARTRPLIRALGRAVPGALVGYVGEVRRGCEVVKRADLLVAASDPESALERAVKALDASVRVADGELALEVEGLSVRVAVVGSRDLGGETFRRTGSAAVVRAVQQRLFERDAASHVFGSEAALLAAAGLGDLPPETRERADVVRLAAAGPLHLVQRATVRGFLHLHTTWSDGDDDLEVMVREAARLGARVVGVADHSRSATYARGLSVERLLEQRDAVAELTARLDGVHVLHGTESDILADGSLDYPDDVLARLDFVVASIHSEARQPREQMTERICRALAHPKVRVLAHPTGRLLLTRQPLDFDLDAVLAAAARHDVAIEVNANPARLDLDWRQHARAVARGVKLAIGVDAHSAASLTDVDYGVLVLRKGLVPPEQVINTWEPERLVAWLRRG